MIVIIRGTAVVALSLVVACGFEANNGSDDPDISLDGGADSNDGAAGRDGAAAGGDGSATDLDGGQEPADGGGAPPACARLASDCESRCSGSFEDVRCTGALSGNFANVTVSEDGNCDLSEALVTGNVTVDEGGRLDLGPNVFVCGNVDASSSGRVRVLSGTTSICSTLQVSGADAVEVAGDLTIRDNVSVSETERTDFDGVNVCGDADFSSNEALRVGVQAPVVIVGNCSSSENSGATFDQVDIFGDNDGCR